MQCAHGQHHEQHERDDGYERVVGQIAGECIQVVRASVARHRVDKLGESQLPPQRDWYSISATLNLLRRLLGGGWQRVFVRTLLSRPQMPRW